MLIGLGEGPIDVVFFRSKVKVTMVTFVKNVDMIFAHYLETCLLHSFHILHAGWLW